MNAKLFCLFFAFWTGGTSNYAAPPSRSPSEMRDAFAELRHFSNNLEAEIKVLEEKIASQEQIIESLQKEQKSAQKTLQDNFKGSSASFDQRLAALESTSQIISSDLSALRQHVEKQNSLILSFNDKLSRCENAVNLQGNNVTHLQTAMKTLTEAFQEPVSTSEVNSSAYKVQPKDTVGGIALKFGITAKALREENKLSSDKIIVGQTLVIPQKTP